MITQERITTIEAEVAGLTYEHYIEFLIEIVGVDYLDDLASEAYYQEYGSEPKSPLNYGKIWDFLGPEPIEEQFYFVLDNAFDSDDERTIEYIESQLAQYPETIFFNPGSDKDTTAGKEFFTEATGRDSVKYPLPELVHQVYMDGEVTITPTTKINPSYQELADMSEQEWDEYVNFLASYNVTIEYNHYDDEFIVQETSGMIRPFTESPKVNKLYKEIMSLPASDMKKLLEEIGGNSSDLDEEVFTNTYRAEIYEGGKGPGAFEIHESDEGLDALIEKLKQLDYVDPGEYVEIYRQNIDNEWAFIKFGSYEDILEGDLASVENDDMDTSGTYMAMLFADTEGDEEIDSYFSTKGVKPLQVKLNNIEIKPVDQEFVALYVRDDKTEDYDLIWKGSGLEFQDMLRI